MSSWLDGLLARPRTILTLLLFLCAAGAAAYVAIPKEANPDIEVPLFYISVVQQGISPEDAERLLVRPLEVALRGLDGLKEIKATASESHAGILLEFEADFDQDEALADVRDKVDQAKAELPTDAEDPTITETNFSLVPTIIVSLSGDVPERTLYQHARRLKDAIETIPTVLSADLSGAREEQLEIVIDRTLIESYQLDPLELLLALQRNNSLIPAGFLDTGEGRFSVKVPGLIEDAEDVYSLVVKENAGSVVTVGDIAEIRRSFKDQTSFTRVNGRPAITIDVVKRLGENVIINNQAVRDAVASASADWPDTIKIDYMLDQSSFIFEVLSGLNNSIVSAILLVMVVIVSSLGMRSALLVGVSIPTTMLISFLVLSGLGMNVNMMVMFGLVLTIGMLVDGGIIMVEYADRRVAEGLSRSAAFVEGSQLMAMPLISSTLTTLIAFLPMLLWPGMAGEFMAYLPIMVIIVLTTALFTAMLFVPAMGMVLSNAVIVGLFAGGIAGGAAYVALEGQPVQLAATGGAFLVAMIAATLIARSWGVDRRTAGVEVLSGPFDLSRLRGATAVYISVLRRLAGSVTGLVVTLVIVAAVATGSVTAFMASSTGVEFFVDEEPDVAVVNLSARGNMSAREALALVRDVEQEVLAIDGVEDVVTSAFPSGGSSGGFNIGMGGDRPADLIGVLQVELVPYCCRRAADGIFADIRARTNFAGVKTEVQEIQGGPPTGKDIQLEVTAQRYDDVLGATSKARAYIEGVAGLRDVEDDRPLPGIEWQLDVDREEAGRFGADVTAVGAMIQLVTNGVLLTKYQPDDSPDQLDVRVRFPASERNLAQFETLRIQTASGLVPLANFIEIRPQPRVSSITRVDTNYAMTIKADVIEEQGYDLTAKIAELDGWVKSQDWPQGVTFKFRGANEDQAEAMGFLVKAMLASLFLMFLVLVTQFNSFYQTALTLSTIVLSVFGVLIGIAVTGQKFSVIMTGTGIVALAGIVVNNAIILIDTYNRERQDQPDALTAVLATAAQRIRPILLTTVTTIAGLIPMATQVNIDLFARETLVGGITAAWWVQLSTAIIGGLTFSTILTLIVVPVMLAMPETLSRAFAARRRQSAAAAERADVGAATVRRGSDKAASRKMGKAVVVPFGAPAEVIATPAIGTALGRARSFAAASSSASAEAPGKSPSAAALDVYAPVLARSFSRIPVQERVVGPADPRADDDRQLVPAAAE